MKTTLPIILINQAKDIQNNNENNFEYRQYFDITRQKDNGTTIHQSASDNWLQIFFCGCHQHNLPVRTKKN